MGENKEKREEILNKNTELRSIFFSPFKTWYQKGE